MFFKASVKEEKILFLFTEGQITNERFLVYINDLLSSGEIADLYTSDEKEGMINNVRGKVKSEGKPDNRDSCWNWFVDSIKRNLHMTICFSPVGDMRRRARQFPALVNCTVIDWFHPWPYEALYGVAKQFLEQVELGDDAIRESVIKFMPFSFSLVNTLSVRLLHLERRYAYTTPKSFLELINLFTNMLSKKRNDLLNNIERYETGLIKLKETEENVAIIEVEVKEKQIEAEAKKKEADDFAEIVGREKDKVEKENDIANIEAEKCAVIKADVEEKKTSTQRDLDAAAPLVEEALASLDTV
jgi:dynein heavy chain